MFKNPFSFDGRIGRTEYGVSILITGLLFLILNVILITKPPGTVSILLLLVLYVPVLWFAIAQGAKRCHDIGDSGWRQFLPFYYFSLVFQDGEPGTNKYGPNENAETVNAPVSYAAVTAEGPADSCPEAEMQSDHTRTY